MDLNTLSKNIELLTVNNVNGWGRDISYTYRKNNINLPSVRAFYQEGDLNKTDTKYDVDQDSAIFYSVDLTDRPQRGDTIEIDGIVWYVESLLASNPYDISCVAKLQHTSGRSSRRNA